MVMTKRDWAVCARAWVRYAKLLKEQGEGRDEIFKVLEFAAECRRRYRATSYTVNGWITGTIY